jgi:hypothetical protein
VTEADYRSEQALIGSERAQLSAFLHDNRTEVVALLEGLTEAQARARLVPSATTLLGIVKHCAFVERVWFHVSLAGRSRPEVGIPESADDSWLIGDDDTVGSVLADYRAAWAEAEEIAAPYDLDDLAVHNRRGPLTLRWIYVHMVGELARHAGHGDILREQVLAAG